MFKDYYAILDVPPGASGEDIRSAFRYLALRYHPDRTQGASPDILLTSPIDGTTATHAAGAVSDSSSPPASPLVDTKTNTHTSSSLAEVVNHKTGRDFTDIQEAYEVLGDVARRYLYDMSYHEALMMREQQRQEEAARRAAHLHAVEAATKHARERQRQRQLHAQAASGLQHPQKSSPSSTPPPPPPLLPPTAASSGGASAACASPSPAAAASLTSPSLMELPPIPAGKRGHHVGETNHAATTTSTGTTMTSFASSMPSLNGVVNHRAEGSGGDAADQPPLPQHHLRRKSRGRGRGGVWSADTSFSTSSSGPRQLKGRRQPRVPPARTALSAPSTFCVTNSLALAAESISSRGSGATATTSSSLTPALTTSRAAGGRPGGLQDGLAEPPLEYYHKRSIERTLRVFFDSPGAP